MNLYKGQLILCKLEKLPKMLVCLVRRENEPVGVYPATEEYWWQTIVCWCPEPILQGTDVGISENTLRRGVDVTSTIKPTLEFMS